MGNREDVVVMRMKWRRLQSHVMEVGSGWKWGLLPCMDLWQCYNRRLACALTLLCWASGATLVNTWETARTFLCMSVQTSSTLEMGGYQIQMHSSVLECKLRYVELVWDGDSKVRSRILTCTTWKKLKSVTRVTLLTVWGTDLLQVHIIKKLCGRKTGALNKDKFLKLAHYFRGKTKEERTKRGEFMTRFVTTRPLTSGPNIASARME